MFVRYNMLLNKLQRKKNMFLSLSWFTQVICYRATFSSHALLGRELTQKEWILKSSNLKSAAAFQLCNNSNAVQLQIDGDYVYIYFARMPYFTFDCYVRRP